MRRLIASAALSLMAVSAALAEPLPLSVASTEVTREVGVTAGLTVTLSTESARAFATLTTANVGRTIDIRIDGKTVLSPVIRDPITGGQLRISGNFERAELDAIAARIASGSSKVEAEVVTR